MIPQDRLSRPLRDLRVSVTDRCNYRCSYCMPFDEYVWIEREEILSFEEITRLVSLFVQLGVEKVRLTGGEPLVRKSLHKLVERLSRVEGLADLSLTTNGSLLVEQASLLKEAGLGRLNVSLDTLREERFQKITRRGDLKKVLKGLETAARVRLLPVKLNMVVIRGFNEDEIPDMVHFCRDHGFSVRFIEYMDVGNATAWSLEKTVAKGEILQILSRRWEVRELGRRDGRAPAVDYRLEPAGVEVGIIGSVTEPFCGSCTRARLTADGQLVTCLFAGHGYDLRGLLRRGASDEELLGHIRTLWQNREDRYSELRWQKLQRGEAYHPPRKLEMITLGG